MIKFSKVISFVLPLLLAMVFIYKAGAADTTPIRLVNDGGTFYLIKDNQRLGITNPGMLYSYGFEFKDAQPAQPSDLALPIGQLVLPGNGALVKSPADPTVWLISNGQKFGFVSQEVFLGLGFKFSSVLTVTAPELNKLSQGSLLNNVTAPHLDGVDINDRGTIYWLSGGQKFGYPSLTVYNSWHKDNDFYQVVPANAADTALPLGGVISERIFNTGTSPISSNPSTTNLTPTTTPTNPPVASNSTPTSTSTTTSLPTAYYVSPQGSDSNSGTINQPFQTIEKAKSVIRTRNVNQTSDITVYLKGGTYTLSQPLNFDFQDSGSNGFNIVYKNYQSENPVISGGKLITGWTQSGNKWKAYVGAGLTIRQFYVNGMREIRARSTGGLAGAVKTATGFTTTDSSMQNWGNKTDIEFVGNTFWKEFRCPVQSITGITIIMQQPCFDRSQADKYQGYDGTMGTPVWIENAYELLNSQGEWYYNRTTGYLYYIPRSGENMATATAVVPMLETLVAGNGTPQSPVHNIKFEGLTFSYATWNKPSTSEGFSEVQANFATYSSGGQFTPPFTNLYFTGARNIQLEKNIFTHLGGAGIYMGNGSQNNLIRGNNFYDISSNGIMIGDITSPKETNINNLTKDNSIVDNYIRRIGAEYQGAVGIWVGYTQNTTIDHNELANLPYTAISVGWGWGADDPTVAQNNKIQNNFIHDHVKALTDGGGIYILSAQPNSIITGNVIQNQADEYGAIYLDSKSRYFNVYNNVLFNNTRSALFKGDDHNIHDNWWQNRVLSGPYPQDVLFTEQEFGTNIVQNNHVIQSLSEAPSSIVSNAGIEPAYQGIKNLVSDTLDPIVKLPQAPAPAPTPTPTPTPTVQKSKIGIFRSGVWNLDTNGDNVWNTQTDTQASFGQAGDVVVLGDWGGNGKTKIGIFRNGTWYLDYNGNGVWDGATVDKQYTFGQSGDIPVVGDWNGNGKTKIGLFRAGVWYLDTNGDGVWDNGVADTQASFGQNGDIPVVGDWSGNKQTKIGLVRNGQWYLDYDGNSVWDNGVADKLYSFGQSGDIPVVADWAGNGKIKIGIFRSGLWQLDTNGDGLWNTQTDTQTNLGQSGDVPVVGDWSGSGTYKIGVFRNGTWYLDTNGDNTWNSANDTQASFGQNGDIPIVGNW